MKHLLILSLFLTTILSCSKQEANYKIEGEIKGARNGFLYLVTEKDGYLQRVDSFKLKKDGKFEFKGFVPSAQMYFLNFGYHKNELGFFIEKTNIKIDAKVDSLAFANVEGGENQALYQKFQDYLRSFSYKKQYAYLDYLQAEVSKDKDKIESATKKLNDISLKEMQFIAQFAMSHSESDLAQFIGLTYLSKQNLSILDSISRGAKKSNGATSLYGAEFAKFVEKIKVTSEGNPVPNFIFNINDKDKLSYSDFKNKPLFIVLWSAEDEMSLAVLNDLKQVYQRLNKDYNFEVISLCLTENKENYDFEIYKLNLPWKDINDFKKIKKEFIETFAFRGDLPATILINKNGLIQKRNITPLEAEKIISQK